MLQSGIIKMLIYEKTVNKFIAKNITLDKYCSNDLNA